MRDPLTPIPNIAELLAKLAIEFEVDKVQCNTLFHVGDITVADVLRHAAHLIAIKKSEE